MLHPFNLYLGVAKTDSHTSKFHYTCYSDEGSSKDSRSQKTL